MGLDFRILGEFAVLRDGDPVDLGSPRQRALLVRLLVDAGHIISTDRLVEDLWSGDVPETARHTLHVYVSRIRKALGDDRTRLEHQGTGYCLTIEPDELDASRFERLAADGRNALARNDPAMASVQLQEALGMWRGDALAEFADEEYARTEAVRLDELRLATLEQKMWAELELGRSGQVVEELQELATRNYLRETLWEQLMLALYRSGRQADALRAYQTVRASLAEELGIEPGPALRHMEERILVQDPSLDLKAAGTEELTPSVLPLQRTSFVGRERELARGAELLTESRLLTLTGPPGSGKTRLALRLADRNLSDFGHGCFFIPLAPITNPNLMADAIARVLGVRETPGEAPLAATKAFLRDRQALLILDNLEQIPKAAPHVGELLDAASELTILATSRAPLRVSGEQEFPVPPLNLPSPNEQTELERLAEHDAVALFVARARAADPEFGLTEENAGAVAAIATQLDGLPLAIELAAARVKLLTTDELLARLDRSLTVLTGGPTDVDERHRTMRDAISWSYNLLEPVEQALFRRLGVCVGGFTLSAASAIADIGETDSLDAVESLLSKSLLYRPVDIGRARFAMLQTIREFALHELDAAGETAAVAERHARYLCRLTEEIEPQLTQDPDGAGMQRLGAEVDNLRAALRYSLEAEEADLGLNLASHIWRFWQSSDQLVEGREWLDLLLAQRNASPSARARGLSADAALAYWLGDYAGALARYEEALSLHRATGNRSDEAEALFALSLTAGLAGDVDAADLHAAAARSIFEELGSQEGVGRVITAQGFSQWKRNNHDAALELYEEGLTIARASGNEAMAVTTLVGIAALTFHLGRRDEALQLITQAIEEASNLHNTHIVVWALDLVAAFCARDEPEDALRLAGAVDALRAEAGGGFQLESLDIADTRTVAAPLLSSERLEREWAEGRGMTVDQAVTLAKHLENTVAASPGS